jgi:hypothetical protein
MHASNMTVVELSQLVLRVAVVIIRASEVRKVCSIVPWPSLLPFDRALTLRFCVCCVVEVYSDVGDNEW